MVNALSMSAQIQNESTAIIVCPTCEARYKLSRDSLVNGRHVRCGKCTTEWTAYLDEEEFLQDTQIEPDVAPSSDMQVSASSDSTEIEAFSSDLQDEEQPFQPEGVVIDALQDKPRKLKKVSDILKVRPTPKPSAWRVATLCFLILTGLYIARESIVSLLPQTAVLYDFVGAGVNKRGLIFEQVETQVEGSGKDKIIRVQGLVVNVAGGVRNIPRVRVSLRDGEGAELMAWTVNPTKDVVNPRAAVTFRTQVASPPEHAEKVFIRFLNKGDIISGMN